MPDPRLNRWANTLAGYCTEVKPEDHVLIRTAPAAEPLVLPLYQACLERGAFPTVWYESPGVLETLLKYGSDAQLTALSPFEAQSASEFDVTVTILGETNTRYLSGADPARQRLHHASRGRLRQRLTARNSEGSHRRCVTLFPTSAYAQDAGMSLADYEAFVFGACFLNDSDPAQQWRDLGGDQQRYVDALVGKKTVRVLAEETDLTLSIEGRTFMNSDGKRNFPSGEFFTGPVEDSANGRIRFSFPAIFGGREVEDVRLWFEGGKVAKATAGRNEAYLQAMLNLDDGARRLGEFAFGNNFGIQRFTRNILFDEKIGGTVHLALGSSYPETGGLNQSALHWDMICDLRSRENGGTGDGGEVRIDGALFSRGGRFVSTG
jgi:aminopeptidase